MDRKVHIIIVTHDSKKEIPVCLSHLSSQSVEITSIILVDSGSKDTCYLDKLKSKWPLTVIKEKNIGFARANNLGYRSIAHGEGSLVIFINPDTFLTSTFVDLTFRAMDGVSLKTCISGKLLSFDLEKMQTTGLIDSAGIYRKWYGRWHDRGQGQVDRGQFDNTAEPPALCGALLCFRYNDLDSFGGEIFDPDFFLYKEDIELGIRLRGQDWKLLYEPGLVAFHCRGWKKERGQVSLEFRKMAARNELILYKKHPSPYMCWALLKYFAVVVLHV